MPGTDLELIEPDDSGSRFEQLREELAELTVQAQKLTAGVGEPGTDLVPTRSSDPAVAKQQMAAVRAQAQKTMAAITAKRKEMERLMREEMERAEALLGPMQALVKHAEQSILTVNLYLGRDEEIVLLRDGASAPADQPITLRQQLLFMDEECAVAAEKGGLRPTNPELFDEWLLADPAHLDQVLPETKGIVALRPRRKLNPQRHGKQDVEANRKTYWLVRNGERIYRTVTALEVGDRVLPYADEFERLFSQDFKGMRVPLRPGSYEWEKAQEAAEETERTYMRVGLVLEGLLHRSPIFHPLPESGVSFLDPMDVRAGKVRYISDAEGQLGSGAESFDDWRERLASELRVGMRIVLGPGLDDYNRRSGGNERLHPEHANHPNPGEVFTIEERKPSGALIFRYREGVRHVRTGGWMGGENREPKRRASCTVYPRDGFVLPFDLATVEDMERFLRSRGDRHHYEEMFPSLKNAIAAKKREVELEAPFRTMLAGVLARENSVDVAAAEAAIPALVDWWKLKNRYHRPLVAAAHQDATVDKQAAGGDHEAKAVRMIVAEHKRRLADERRAIDPEIVAKLRAEHPHALLIARPRRAGYLVLDPAEPTKNVWVHETEYTASGELKERREWVQPGVTRPKQWKVVHTTDRWDAWDLTADAREHLTGPEAQALTEQVISDLSRGGERPLALAFDGAKFTAWTWRRHVSFDSEHLLTVDPEYAVAHQRERGWERKAGRVHLTRWSYGSEESLTRRSDEAPLPWQRLEFRAFDDYSPEPRKPVYDVVWTDSAAVAELEAELARYFEAVERSDELTSYVRKLTKSVEQQWLDRAWAAERERFDEDFGDPELWEAHKKSKERHVRFPYELVNYANSFTDRPNKLSDALASFVELGEDPAGRTVGDVIDEATERFLPGLAASEEDKTWTRTPLRFEVPDELREYVLQSESSPLDKD